MTYLKKTAVAVLALGSSAVFAGTMGPVCTANPVTVPCETIAWDFGGKALYLQTNLNNHFAYDTFILDVNGRDLRFDSFNDNWNWGFMIEGSYHFSTGNDLNVNWYHLSNSNNGDDHRPVGLIAANGTIIAETAATLDYNPKWDAVNIEFGQHVDFGEFKDIRFHAGGQFARVTHDYDVVFAPNAAVASHNNKYNGFGVRTGADMAYNFGNGVAIYGNAAAAILVGTSSFSNVDLFGNLPRVLAFNTSGSKTTLVPELEGKLGATYTYGMPQGNLILDVGYMWVNYFNAINNFTRGHSDFGVNGVDFGLKYVGVV